MLGKLIKYELRCTYTLLLFLYCSVIGLSVILKVSNLLIKTSQIFSMLESFFTILYVFILIASFAVTAVLLILRFEKNLTRDEGYLMHMLPVRTEYHILAKLVNSFIWTVSSVVAALLSIFILAYYKGIFNDIGGFLDVIRNELIAIGLYNNNLAGFIVMVVLYVIIACFTQYMMIYAAISMGQFFRKFRIGGMVLSYFILYFVNQFFYVLTITIMNFSNIEVIIKSFTSDNSDVIKLSYTFIIGIIVVSIVTNILYFLLTNLILKKKLNLE